MVPLSILCQSPVSEGMRPRDAVQHTVTLARDADELGYHRFWVAEHHADQALASASPEVMVSHLASITKRIRVGSGGVLLPYYRPLKVAEQFNLLEALFPGRIDLGLGRSGGSEGHAPQALGLRKPSFDDVDELLSWLGPGRHDRPYADTFASPQVASSAQPWVLGTSPTSARYAARRGLPYAFGGFLDPRGMLEALAAYHQHFTPGPHGERPRVILAWYAQPADTQAEAEALARTSEHWFVETFLRGGNPTFPDPARLGAASYTPMEQMAIAMRRQFALVGTAERVLSGVEELVRQTAADEVMLVSIPFDPQARRHGYRLLAEAW